MVISYQVLARSPSSVHSSAGSQLPGIIMGDKRPPQAAAALASAEMGRDRGVSVYDGSQMR
jgi:hypothetical protein